MNVYELDNVELRRGNFQLRIDSLHIRNGRIHAIAGPNGSGKTTLLNLLAFLSDPWRGRLDFRGKTIAPSDQAALLAGRRQIGFLMQNPYLFNTTVRKNIQYGLSVRRISRRDADRRVEEIAETLELSHLLPANAHRLSGGEAQRVALARTLAFNPNVLLLDEPTANVDKQNIHTIERLVKTMSKTGKTSVIMTTHSADQAYRMAEHIISIIDGRATDAGYENVFSGILRQGSDGTRAVSVTGDTEFLVASGDEGRVMVAIDPAEIILSTKELHSSALNRLHGPITRTEDANGSVRVFVDCGVVLCALVTAKSYTNLRLNVGKKVWATFKANAVKVL